MRIICTVTNDLVYDQRMQRICTALQATGHTVCLIGRTVPGSVPLPERSFRQLRLRCHFRRGFLFYAEYNLRLFWYLMTHPWDSVCSVDLDTLPAGATAAFLRRKKKVFDAHEYFTEVPELQNRPWVQAFWRAVARLFLPGYRQAYTVGPILAGIFSEQYGVPFGVVRNMPTRRKPVFVDVPKRAPILLYQGALNEGRGIEAMLEAMTRLPDMQLWLAGEGDLSQALRKRAADLNLNEQQVRFLGYLSPEALHDLTPQAWLGINLLENKGLSYYYSLANKYFDYVQAGVPQLTMQFPEYLALQETYPVAMLLPDLDVSGIVAAIRHLQQNPGQYEQMQSACMAAADVWNWEKEQEKLWTFYT